MHNLYPYKKAKKIMTPAEKVGQLFMPAAFINDSEEEIQQLETLIHKHHIGSLCFFHSRASAATNFEGKKAIVYNKQSFDTLKKLILRYQKVAKFPLLIAIDAEWGLAMRIENTPQYPYAITLGAIAGNVDLIRQVGKNIAHDCKQAGIHWNLAPVADININPNNPVIGYRSFGENKFKVVEKALAFMEGTKSENVLTSIKHFPGHGDTATDSHLGLPILLKTEEELWDTELYSFRELITSGVDSVMVGHLAIPILTHGEPIPATISKDIIQKILRDKLGYNGAVISDALNMHSVAKLFPTKGELEWLAFDAGIDVLCFAEHVAEGIEFIVKNTTVKQLEDSFQRLWVLKEKALQSHNESTENLINPDPLNQKIAAKSLTNLKNNKTSISNFIKEGFAGLVIGKDTNTRFFKDIATVHPFQIFSTAFRTKEEIKSGMVSHENVLIALYPPKVKPQNNYDLLEEELKLINDFIHNKNVVIYLFGNPYVLNLVNFDKAKEIVLVYQDFEVFQTNAAQHFLGNCNAPGKLPVTLMQNESL